MFAFLCCVASAFARVNATEMISYPGGKCYMFRVTLKDKNHSRYSLNAPSEYLSPRAIERRKRQHLAIDSTDLPLNESYLHAISASKELWAKVNGITPYLCDVVTQERFMNY